MRTTAEMIEVMQAYERGEAIEWSERDVFRWRPCSSPIWDWSSIDYRIAHKSKPSIKWDHVAPEYMWLARDNDGYAYVYTEKPEKSVSSHWSYKKGKNGLVNSYASYTPGNCDWTESLVERPQ